MRPINEINKWDQSPDKADKGFETERHDRNEPCIEQIWNEQQHSNLNKRVSEFQGQMQLVGRDHSVKNGPYLKLHSEPY